MNKKVILSLTALLLIAGISNVYASTTTTKECDCQHKGFQERPMLNQENFEAIQDAIKNRDYQTWSELTADHPMAENITEENFEKFAKMHELREELRGLEEELGIGHRKGFGKMGAPISE